MSPLWPAPLRVSAAGGGDQRVFRCQAENGLSQHISAAISSSALCFVLLGCSIKCFLSVLETEFQICQQIGSSATFQSVRARIVGVGEIQTRRSRFGILEKAKNVNNLDFFDRFFHGHELLELCVTSPMVIHWTAVVRLFFLGGERTICLKCGSVGEFCRYYTLD